MDFTTILLLALFMSSFTCNVIQRQRNINLKRENKKEGVSMTNISRDECVAVMMIAETCYEAVEAYQRSLGDSSGVPWAECSEKTVESVIATVKYCLQDPKATPPSGPRGFTSDQWDTQFSIFKAVVNSLRDLKSQLKTD